ncbi:MAG: DivIVA domain-containing protein [Ruminococcaceae bacterium]|nr:DivIVA domain-containing protein [Oscillospiraceae bacterium]
MISANDLRNKKFSPEQNGYNVDEVNAALSEAADTIEGYINENKELYRKMEVLARKIEEYREDEDSIKSALITAQKMADKLEKESSETAALLISKSEETANTTIADAQEKADKMIAEAREYSSNLIKEKNEEAEAVIADAQKKANDAINSSKIVAQNILDQAKEISDDLISTSKSEVEAYRILTKTAKQDAKTFIDKLIALYSEQLEVLNGANLDTADEKEQEQELDAIHSELDSLVSEIDEIQNAIPDEMIIDSEETEEETAEEETEAQADEAEEKEAEEELELDDDEDFDDIEDAFSDYSDDDEEEEFEDPMKAVAAFSADELTPVDAPAIDIPEIEEDDTEDEKSLFDEEEKSQPFESYFNISSNDAHYDRNQTISLVPPEDEEDEPPKFKGFFKKKK